MEAAVEACYVRSRPFYSNLLDDMGATDTFVVDGDCLLLELLTASDRVDWAHGGQFLQLRAMLEQFFQALNKANTTGLKYWVVWFESNASLLPDEAARLARTLALAWLPGALHVPELRFLSWWAQDWLSWLAAVRPSLILLTDLPQAALEPSSGGSVASSSSRSSSNSIKNNEGLGTPADVAASPPPGVGLRGFLHAYIVHSMLGGPQCAFMRELRFPEGHMFGFRTRWRSAAQRDGREITAARAVGRAFQRHQALGAAAAGLGGGPTLDPDSIPGLVSLVCSTGTMAPGEARARLGAACCGALAVRSPASLPRHLLPMFIRAWCLHELLVRRLRLPQRALRLPSPGLPREAQQGLRAFLSRFHAAASVLVDAGARTGEASLGSGGGFGPCFLLDPSMADWLDGRLMHAIVGALLEGLPTRLIPEEEADMDGLSQLIQASCRVVAAAAAVPASSGWGGGFGAALEELLVVPGQLGSPGPGWALQQRVAAGSSMVHGEHGAPSGQAHGRSGQDAVTEAPVKLLPVVGNALVEEVIAGGAGEGGRSTHSMLQCHDLDSREVQAAREVLQAPYGANFHYHSGASLEGRQLQMEYREEQASLEGMSLEEIAASSSTPAWARKRANMHMEQLSNLRAIGSHGLAVQEEKKSVAKLVERARNTERNKQLYYKHMTKYAQSLDTSKYSKPRPRSLGGSANSTALAGPQGMRSKAGKKPPAIKKVELMRQQNTEAQLAKKGNSAEQQWLSLHKRLTASIAVGGWSADVAAEIDSALSNLAAKSPTTYLAAASWKVTQLSALWRAEGRQRGGAVAAAAAGMGDASRQLQLAVPLWAAVYDLVQRGLLCPGDGKGVEEEQRMEAAAECQRALMALGLHASAEHVVAIAATGQSGASQQKSKAKGSGKGAIGGGSGKPGQLQRQPEGQGEGGSSWRGLGMSDVRFQLRHCGHLLPHDEPSERDPRVESFNPDPWQRQVLDAIDVGASALIVAPTSSGKTFISSYCINSVVRGEGDPEGLLVFVAPTKALVNQVAAQVYKDFQSEEVTVGVFTRDYRSNVESCRILVTVPACLEILLLSPSAQERVQRMRYVILDEVHCMREVHLGEGRTRDGSGSTWEHILLLLRCPFLALSATIGNPGEFRDWLASIKQLQAEQDSAAGRKPPAAGPSHYQVQLIQHSTRHSDLRLYTYVPGCLQRPLLRAGSAASPLQLRGSQQAAAEAAAEVAAEADWASSDDDDGNGGTRRFLPPSERIASLEGSGPGRGVSGRPARSSGGGGSSSGGGSALVAGQARGPGMAAAGDGVLGECGSLARMNPLAALEVGDLEQGSFPPEMSLEPADVEELYDSMHSALQWAQRELGAECQPWQAKAAAELAKLDPEVYFACSHTSRSSTARHGLATTGCGSTSPFLSRGQVRQYERDLKALLLSWASGSSGQGAGHAAAAAVLRTIRDSHYQEPKEHGATLQRGAALVGLLLDLLCAGMLPCLVFNFDRSKCHALADALVEYLEECEAQDRARNAAKYEARRLEAERAARAAKARRDKKPDRHQGDGAGGGEEGGTWEPAFDEDAVLQEYSLAGKPKRLSTADVEQLIKDVIRASTQETGDVLIRGLRRGVGIHHGGLPKAYRQVVEILFRAGHLRVVIATGTLAFGINMPCRSVVFAGDHLFLSALQFRQMMGRAGRRGFDPLGHVVFFGVGSRKIRSLMVSPVPRLMGHFPLTVTMCLRALAMHSIVASSATTEPTKRQHSSTARQGAGAPPGALAANTLAVLFQRPFFASRDPVLMQQVQHLFRFSTEYLMRTGAIGLRGEPVGLAGMLCHLHWTDPANLAFASLLRSGALDEICKGAAPGMSADAFEPVAEAMLVVLAHLFQALPLHRGVLLQPERFKHSPSKVVLEGLPGPVQAAMDRHNREALCLFVDYVRCYVGALPCQQEGAGGGGDGAAGDGSLGVVQQALPLSGVMLPAGPTPAVGAAAGTSAPEAAAAGRPTFADNTSNIGSLQDLVSALRVPYQVCSPWAALSGRGDDFGSMDDLVRSVRSGILLDIAALPAVTFADRHGEPVPLNRYVLDYWRHQQKGALVEANGLREGDAWQALSAFVEVLRAMAVALGQLVPPGCGHPVVYVLERLAGEYRDKFEVFNSQNKNPLNLDRAQPSSAAGHLSFCCCAASPNLERAMRDTHKPPPEHQPC